MTSERDGTAASRTGARSRSPSSERAGQPPVCSSVPNYRPTPLSAEAAEAAAAAAAAAAEVSERLNAMFQPPPPDTPPPPEVAKVGAEKAAAIAGVPLQPMQPPAPSCKAPPLEGERRHRKLYVGNLPPGVTSTDVSGFFNGALLAANAQTNFVAAEPGVTPTQLLPLEKCGPVHETTRHCYIELRSQSWAVLCLKLDGIAYHNFVLKISRPGDYTPAAGGDPAETVQIPGLEPRRSDTVAEGVRASAPPRDADCKLYVQHLPPEMGEDQVRDLFEQFGKLRFLNLIKNHQTGQHRGYGFFEYEDPEVTEQALQTLDGFVCGSRVLSVQRSNFTADVLPSKNATVKVTELKASVSHAVLGDPMVAIQVRAGRAIGENPSKVVQLLNVACQEDLMTDASFDSLVEAVKNEAGKYGSLEEVKIPRPSSEKDCDPGVGKVFLVYSDLTSARRAQLMLNGRKFDGTRVVCAAFFPEDKFRNNLFTLT